MAVGVTERPEHNSVSAADRVFGMSDTTQSNHESLILGVDAPDPPGGAQAPGKSKDADGADADGTDGGENDGVDGDGTDGSDDRADGDAADGADSDGTDGRH